jgi:hypothetical protein
MKSIALTSITPGRNLVVLESTCVSTIAKNMCQPVKKKGNWKFQIDKMALFNRIYRIQKNECCTETIVKGKLVVKLKMVKGTDHNA